MSVNAVDWALRFAPVDARHNGAARVLMCLANVAQVQRGHGQTPLVMAGRGTCGDGAAVPSA